MVESDVVIIGPGHNGLVAATYLAKAGLQVVVLERANRVGGACVTDEIAPGFRVSRAAYVSGLLRPQIIEDLDLTKYGLRQVAFDPQAFCPFPDGRALRLWYNRERTCREIAKFSARDAAAYPRYDGMWAEVHNLIEPMLLAPPVPISELAAFLRAPEAEGLFRRLLFYCAADLLREYFESDEVIAALANQSVIGHFAGPSSPGTAFTLAHNLLGNIDGRVGGWGFVLGGMGALPAALEAAARATGVEIHLNASVARILVRHGRAVGVRLASGRTILAKAVLSTADPKRTFLDLVDADDLPAEFLAAVRRIKMHGAAMKVNCAVSELPRWTAPPETPRPHHRGSAYIGPSIEYVEEAFADAKRGDPPSIRGWMS